MKKSEFLRRVGDENHALYYHSLFGRMFLLDKGYIDILESKEISDVNKKSQIFEDLIQNGYIIENNYDERSELSKRCMSFLEQDSKQRIVYLDLNISELCNFICPHCMNGCQISNPKEKLMTWDIAKKAIDNYANLMHYSNKDGDIHFGSAEPLINWKILKKAVLYIRENIPDAQISVNSNLSLLTKERAEFLRDNNVYIATSLDGPKNGNDLIRFSKKGGTYDTIIEKMDLLQEIGYPLDGCSITMNDLNMNFINADFIHMLHDRGCIGIATDIDLVNNSNCKQNVDVYVNKLISIYKLCKELKMENFGSWTKVFHNLTNQEDDELLFYCKAQAGKTLSINPVGDIFICGYSVTKLGNILSFNQFFDSNQRFYNLLQSRLPGENPMCFGCDIEGICTGQCLVTSEFSSESNNRINFLCDFYRKVTAQLLELKLAEEV